LTRSSHVCHQKIFLSPLHSIGIKLIPVEFWLRPHQWCQAAGTPLLSSVDAVDDVSLPTNISEDAQQSSGTYKNFHFIFSAHMCMCLFASVENSVMSVTKKGFEERAATVFKRKVAKMFDNVGDHLFKKLNISGIFLLSFSPNASEND